MNALCVRGCVFVFSKMYEALFFFGQCVPLAYSVTQRAPGCFGFGVLELWRINPR